MSQHVPLDIPLYIFLNFPHTLYQASHLYLESTENNTPEECMEWYNNAGVKICFCWTTSKSGLTLFVWTVYFFIGDMTILTIWSKII